MSRDGWRSKSLRRMYLAPGKRLPPFHNHVHVKKQRENNHPEGNAQNDEHFVDLVALFGKAFAGAIKASGTWALFKLIEADTSLHGHRLIDWFFGWPGWASRRLGGSGGRSPGSRGAGWGAPGWTISFQSHL